MLLVLSSCGSSPNTTGGTSVDNGKAISQSEAKRIAQNIYERTVDPGVYVDSNNPNNPKIMTRADYDQNFNANAKRDFISFNYSYKLTNNETKERIITNEKVKCSYPDYYVSADANYFYQNHYTNLKCTHFLDDDGLFWVAISGTRNGKRILLDTFENPERLNEIKLLGYTRQYYGAGEYFRPYYLIFPVGMLSIAAGIDTPYEYRLDPSLLYCTMSYTSAGEGNLTAAYTVKLKENAISYIANPFLSNSIGYNPYSNIFWTEYTFSMSWDNYLPKSFKLDGTTSERGQLVNCHYEMSMNLSYDRFEMPIPNLSEYPDF